MKIYHILIVSIFFWLILNINASASKVESPTPSRTPSYQIAIEDNWHNVNYPDEVKLAMDFLNINTNLTPKAREKLLFKFIPEVMQNSRKNLKEKLLVEILDKYLKKNITPDSKIEIAFADKMFCYNQGKIWGRNSKMVFFSFSAKGKRWNDPYLVIYISVEAERINIFNSIINGKNLLSELNLVRNIQEDSFEYITPIAD